MTDEEMRKMMGFLLNQQAQFASDLGALKDRFIEFEGVVSRLAQATLGRFEAADERAEDTDRKIAALVDSQLRTEERAEETDRKIAALVDSQLRTEESIRNLTAVVDRYFSEGRNGR